MLQNIRLLILKLTAIVLVGIVAAKIDPWARDNPDDYLGAAQWILFVILFFVFLFHGASGRLKSGPDRPRSADIAKRSPVIPVLMAGYLFVLAIAAVSLVFLGFRLDEHITSPLVTYFVFVPFALISLLGRHKVKRDMQTANPEESPAESLRSSYSLTEMTRGFFDDKLRIAVMSCLFSLLCFGIWLGLDDDGALVAGIICAGFSVQQYYRHTLRKRESSELRDR